ncbi:DeoR family transcriptional regulator [Gemmiger formicilis]|uniref:DeoR family transcriptional regulator n=1 Tax=Gemmiger formicilis TaxID=745368 RepID=UPI00297409BC|nr:DeoR family transcriptional regulator [Subdoligranulum variabile]
MSSADRRQAEILELLYMHEKCNVNDFVERFGVSRRNCVFSRSSCRLNTRASFKEVRESQL